ncbi:ParB N-terminal domain-containing protein [Nonomuraea antimicrobica]|uniref:ParB N-terminal domain-containing protein n=1 Tax=Nonomuraea antimicrobica TaxID=561173 RepID=A0ABP7D1V9_9ACTN
MSSTRDATAAAPAYLEEAAGSDRPPGFGAATVRVPTDVLRNADSPRLAGVDLGHVRTLAEIADELPPIIVHRETMRVIDGMHRLHAARLGGRESVEVVYFHGTEQEAFLLAVESNVRHGLPLTLAERKESARRILRSFPEWSDRAIAAKTGLSGKTVGALRRTTGPQPAQPPVRVGRDGRARPLSPVDGRLKAGDILTREPHLSLREVAKAAGVSVETARDVRERLSRGKSPLPVGRGGPSAAGPCQVMPPTEPTSYLASLRRDPALKYNDEGRLIIRCLEARLVRERDAELVLRAPDHQAMQIAAMARACAMSWDKIATHLERRSVERL